MGSAFIGKAKVRVALYSAGTTFENRPFRYLENVSAFQFSFAEEEKKLLDYASAAGGVDASIKRITDVTGSMDLRHFTADNLALALWGTTAALSAVAIVDEAGYKIVPLAFVPTKRLINTSVAPVVKKGATVVSTSTRNFPNRLGKNTNVYLASAELSAVASKLGRIPTLEEYRAETAVVAKNAESTTVDGPHTEIAPPWSPTFDRNTQLSTRNPSPKDSIAPPNVG